ncbi:RNaseH domain-containing protein [Natroniella acetigena]|uniref:RNaseH domain-containing protein n=1 Tax=Natroniella acetigena TaxID=52004 RepID=UPI00200B0721|nr:RNaseH domain-containing protein [Natroniella acetigena]MCK8826577.1 RNaseH domain-containing protein [Natroniella acetigena]
MSYWGNRFYSIPLKSTDEKIKLQGVSIVKVSASLCTKLSLLMDNQRKNYQKQRGNFSIKRFSRLLQGLNYPVIYAKNDFYKGKYKENGWSEWLYLDGGYEKEDFDIFKKKFKYWLENNLSKREFRLISNVVDEIELESLATITFSSNPFKLSQNKSHYLYRVYPKYLAHKLSGEINLELKSYKKDQTGISKLKFYKLMNGYDQAEMINLPFKFIGEERKLWSYSLDFSIRTIPDIKYPFLFLNLRSTLLLKEIPNYVRGSKNINAIIYNKNSRKYNAAKVPLQVINNWEKWAWKYDFQSGFINKSNWINNLSLEGEYQKEDIILSPEKTKGVGIIYGSHISMKHLIDQGSSEFDEEEVYSEVLRSLKNQEHNTNIIYDDFLELKNIKEKVKIRGRRSNKFRIKELLDSTDLVINAYYINEEWRKIIKEQFLELIDSSTKNTNRKVVKINISKEERTEFMKNERLILDSNKKIKFNFIKFSEDREKFMIEESQRSLEKFEELFNNKINGVKECEFALFELQSKDEFNNYVDPKFLIRHLLTKNNYLSQFITTFNPEGENNLFKYKSGLRDLLRQTGFMGRSVNRIVSQKLNISGKEGCQLIGLWYYSKNKSGFEYGKSDKELSSRISFPILVAIVDDEIKIPVFNDDILKEYRWKNRLPRISWVSYSEGLLKIHEMVEQLDKVFVDKNDNIKSEIKKAYITQALDILRERNEKQIIFTNAQNSRQYIHAFQNSNLSKIQGIEMDFKLPKNSVLIRVVTNERGETPNWNHLIETELSEKRKVKFGSLKEGVFKVSDRIYYLINPKTDAQSCSSDLKEFVSRDKRGKIGRRMSVLEVDVFNTAKEEVKEYIALTKVLRHRSFPVSFGQPIRLPFPLHLAKAAEEYLDAYYEQYFLKKYLKK